MFLFQRKRAVLHKTHYVELLLVVDNLRVRARDDVKVISLWRTACHHVFFFLQYNFMNRNATAVREEMVLLANLVDSVSFSCFFLSRWTHLTTYKLWAGRCVPTCAGFVH